MTSLYQIIKLLQSTQGSKAKLAVLEAHKDNELLKAYLKAVYDPRLNYYMTKVPKAEKIGDRDLQADDIQSFIDNIASRKMTGGFAKTRVAIHIGMLNAEGQELFGYIIKRDIKAGVGEGTILKVWPDLFFIPPYQRCASMSDKLVAKFAAMRYFFVESKNDGQFDYVINRFGSSAVVMTRAGSTHPQWLANQLANKVPLGHVAAGELVVYQNRQLLNRQTGNGILNAILQGDEKGKFDENTMEVKFVAWDLLTTQEFDQGYSDRRNEDRFYFLENCTTLDLTRRWKVDSIEQAYKLQTEHLERKEEGTVWKDPDGKWRDCSSGDPCMMKAKLVFQADYEIEGAYEGEGKYVGMLGGFNMKTRDNLIKFNVGSGFSDQQRADYWKMLQQNGMDCFNGSVCAIEGNDIVESKGKDTESVFLPIFLELRLDKTVADDRAAVYAAFEDAKLGRKAAGR